MDAESGALSEPELAAELASPSFVAVHPGGGFLYAVSGQTESTWFAPCFSFRDCWKPDQGESFGSD